MFFNDAEWSFEHDVVMLTWDLSNTNMCMYDAVFLGGCFPTYSALPLFHISLYKNHPSLYLFSLTNTSHQKWKLWWYIIAARSYLSFLTLRWSLLDSPGWMGLFSSLSSSNTRRKGLLTTEDEWESWPPQTEPSSFDLKQIPLCEQRISCWTSTFSATCSGSYVESVISIMFILVWCMKYELWVFTMLRQWLHFLHLMLTESVMKRAFFSGCDMFEHRAVKTLEIPAIWPSGKVVLPLEVCWYK